MLLFVLLHKKLAKSCFKCRWKWPKIKLIPDEKVSLILLTKKNPVWSPSCVLWPSKWNSFRFMLWARLIWKEVNDDVMKTFVELSWIYRVCQGSWHLWIGKLSQICKWYTFFVSFKNTLSYSRASCPRCDFVLVR